MDILAGAFGEDTLDYSIFGSAAVFNLTSIGTADGFNGTETASGIAFENINTLVGSASIDSLDGLAGDSTWLVTDIDAGQYTSQSRTIEFSSIESIAGDTGTNTLSYAGQTGAVTVSLTGIGTLHGFTGTGTCLTTGFDNIDIITGGSNAADMLTGAALDAVWALSGTPVYSAGGQTLTITEFETLVGGSASDAFTLIGSNTFAGTISGGMGTGVDTLDYSAYTSPVSVTLTANGSVQGMAGTATGITGFDNIDVLTGSSGTDTLTGADFSATFELDGTDRYFTGTRQVSFSAFELLNGGSLDDIFRISGTRTYDLNGGAGDDRFVFAAGGSLNGLLDGSVGLDTTDFSAFTTSLNVYLTAVSPLDGFSGTINGLISNPFTNIDRLTASTIADKDQIYGFDIVSQWDLNGSA